MFKCGTAAGGANVLVPTFHGCTTHMIGHDAAIIVSYARSGFGSDKCSSFESAF
jgi:L-serine deaminase